jgi:small nuclear ribonucleoprotein (snRNP)-like protein
MRIHNPQEEKKNKEKPSKMDGQVHGGMMESVDQFANLISGAVSNVGDNQEENTKKKNS